MLVSILDLENVTVNDIMVPRNEVVGIDLEDDTDTILRQLRSSQHTRLPIFKGDINNIQGILHLRSAARLLQEADINKAMIMQLCQEPYFIPESTASMSCGNRPWQTSTHCRFYCISVWKCPV